jgi:hypothetical protein
LVSCAIWVTAATWSAHELSVAARVEPVAVLARARGLDGSGAVVAGMVTGVGNLGTLRARLYRDLETKQRPMSSMDPSRRACYAVAQTTYGVIVTSPINASDFTRTCQPSPATVGAEAANTAKPSPTLSVSSTRHRRVVSY